MNSPPVLIPEIQKTLTNDQPSEPLPLITIEVTSQQSILPIDAKRLEAAVREVLLEAEITTGEISIAVVDDPTMHELNRKHLNHDYPTDVLSFCLEESPGQLKGEVVVSADTAIENARDYGWSPESELLLYVLHGTLHLVGFRDKGDAETLAMREAESRHLLRWGVETPADSKEEASS